MATKAKARKNSITLKRDEKVKLFLGEGGTIGIEIEIRGIKTSKRAVELQNFLEQTSNTVVVVRTLTRDPSGFIASVA